jgi:probable rRNA maturation factor
MTISIINESDIDYPEVYDSIIMDIIDASIEYLKCPHECEVSVTLVDNDEMHDINLSERGIDSPTDVLSFPMLDFDKPGDLSYVEKYPQDYFNPETHELLLGDIVISVDHVREQAESFGHSLKREYAFLICHSMLHLMGYDHMEDDERIEMEAEQKRIMEALQINRDTVED